MRKYEVMYIVKPNIAADQTKKVIETLNTVIKDGKGKVTDKKDIGLKDLAYPIMKFEKGYYYWMMVQAEPATIAELKRIIGINENIIRSIILKEDE